MKLTVKTYIFHFTKILKTKTRNNCKFLFCYDLLEVDAKYVAFIDYLLKFWYLTHESEALISLKETDEKFLVLEST